MMKAPIAAWCSFRHLCLLLHTLVQHSPTLLQLFPKFLICSPEIAWAVKVIFEEQQEIQRVATAEKEDVA